MNRAERRKMLRNKKYRNLVKNEARKAVNEMETAFLKKYQNDNKNLESKEKVN